MAAIGQGGGVGGGPAGDGGAAGGTQPGGQQPGVNQPPPEGGDDPFGFGAHVANAPEHLRPYVQTALDQLRPQLEQQLGQWQPYEQLRPALEQALIPADPENPEGGTVLEALLNLHQISSDPNQIEAFQEWWDSIGDAYGFWGDEEGGQPPEFGLDGQPPEPGQPGQPDPRDQMITELRQQLEQVTQRLDQGEQDRQIQTAQQQVQTELRTLMAQQNIVDNEQLPPEQRASTVILRLAQSYDSPDAVQRGVADYLALTGQAQGQMVQQAGQQTTPIAGLDGLPPLPGAPAGGAPMVGGGVGRGGGHGAALEGGRADHEPQHVRSWDDAKRIAMQRLQEAEAASRF